ncbi:MAG TPA: GNAT family protein [Corynebacterium sp.]|nr:GNAT family protein [Corynebacterium sp.]
MDPFGLAAARYEKPATGPRDPVHPGWPESTPMVHLTDGTAVRLRPLTNRDSTDWAEIRLLDEKWLRPVEPTVTGTWAESHSAAAWRDTFSYLRSLASRGAAVPLVIEVDGEFAGQTTIGNIQHGAVSEAWIGYWVHSAHMGRGVATAACALGTDHAFSRIGLHRVTATYLPENPASGKVLLSNGFREEGYLRENLHIDGQWRDHHFVAQNVDDYPDTCIARLRGAGRLR